MSKIFQFIKVAKQKGHVSQISTKRLAKDVPKSPSENPTNISLEYQPTSPCSAEYLANHVKVEPADWKIYLLAAVCSDTFMMGIYQ